MQQTASHPIEDTEHSAYQKIRLDLALAARRWRRRSNLSRRELAEKLIVDPSIPAGRVVEGESATLDLLVRSLLALGATQRDIALEIVRNA